MLEEEFAQTSSMTASGENVMDTPAVISPSEPMDMRIGVLDHMRSYSLLVGKG